MSKARDLADFTSAGSVLEDGVIDVSEVTGAAPLASPTFTGTVSAGDISSTGAVTATSFSGDGSALTESYLFPLV